jgi:hypothetical protein
VNLYFIAVNDITVYCGAGKVDRDGGALLACSGLFLFLGAQACAAQYVLGFAGVVAIVDHPVYFSLVSFQRIVVVVETRSLQPQCQVFCSTLLDFAYVHRKPLLRGEFEWQWIAGWICQLVGAGSFDAG